MNTYAAVLVAVLTPAWAVPPQPAMDQLVAAGRSPADFARVADGSSMGGLPAAGVPSTGARAAKAALVLTPSKARTRWFHPPGSDPMERMMSVVEHARCHGFVSCLASTTLVAAEIPVRGLLEGWKAGLDGEEDALHGFLALMTGTAGLALSSLFLLPVSLVFGAGKTLGKLLVGKLW